MHAGQKIHKTKDEDEDRTNMLFEQDRRKILFNEVIRDRDVPLHRPYSCHSDGLKARDGVSKKRDNELNEGVSAKATMDELRGEDYDDVSSPVKITAIQITSEDGAVPREPMNAEIKVKETAADREDPRNRGSDRNLLSHHMGDIRRMGGVEEHGQSEMITKETDSV